MTDVESHRAFRDVSFTYTVAGRSYRTAHNLMVVPLRKIPAAGDQAAETLFLVQLSTLGRRALGLAGASRTASHHPGPLVRGWDLPQPFDWLSGLTFQAAWIKVEEQSVEMTAVCEEGYLSFFALRAG